MTSVLSCRDLTHRGVSLAETRSLEVGRRVELDNVSVGRDRLQPGKSEGGRGERDEGTEEDHGGCDDVVWDDWASDVVLSKECSVRKERVFRMHREKEPRRWCRSNEGVDTAG